MSQLTHQPCPFADCKSHDAFAWDADDRTGYCHSCSGRYPAAGHTKGINLKDWAKETYPVIPLVDAKRVQPDGVTYEGIRSLDADVAKYYGIQLQTYQGQPLRYAYKYPGNTKYRDYHDKKKSWYKETGLGSNDLFGPDFNAGTSKRIYITEGEFDAASLYQILDKRWPVMSLPSASIGDKFFQKNKDYLDSFSEIVYAGELDAAGRKAADKFYSIFPKKFWYVPMSKYKDANDFLQAGDTEDLKWAAVKAQRYSPENFFISEDAVTTAILNENPYEYVPTGHEGLDSMIRGLVKGGLTFIKAPRGTGKTEVIRYLEIGLLKNSDTAVFAGLHMEEMKSTTYRAMATYELGINVRTKDDAKANGLTEEQVVQAARQAVRGERTILFEMRSDDNPMSLLDHIRTAATVYGADFIFIDHVQRLAYLSQAGVDGATSTLTMLGSQAAQLAKELNIGVVFISQVNDDGRTKYAGALEEEAIICIKLDRDTETEDPIEGNTTTFIVDKNRPFAKLGKAGSVFYDHETTILRENF
jgi:KaiC/GvpD/RAD55 family RecA-like ATPase